jgi:CubicO group peptidase (beta-lactamase class C family)
MNRPDKKDITIEQCLLHRAGFIGDNPMKDFTGSIDEMLERIYAAKLAYEPGAGFTYSDNSFIVLGAVVAAVSGQPLDQFALKNIFQPLNMTDTRYGPLKAIERVAPTEKRDGKFMIGEVHDPRAYAMNHVAGHAGVFGTAEDVARWCRMILGNGQLGSQRIMSVKTAKEMTTKRCLPDGKNCRGYGLDFTSALADSPRGNRFVAGETFGHTGYTGTMFWIDPKSEVFFVLLTNRVHPDGKGDVKSLRRKVATIVGEALLGASPTPAGNKFR